jgi:murein L,D-transpeptidase YcbB/YkuD
MAEHGPSFGFWNTVRSEAWHWTYCLGDDPPAGVPLIGGTASAAKIAERVAERLQVPEPAPVDWQAIAATDAKMMAVVFPGELVQGAKGEAVGAMQWKLAAAGQDVKVDGDFGKHTAAAVMAFQTEHGLTPDGRVGKRTWIALGLHPV